MAPKLTEGEIYSSDRTKKQRKTRSKKLEPKEKRKKQHKKKPRMFAPWAI